MESTNRTVCITIPAAAEFIDVIRLALYGVAARMGFSYEAIEDMKVAVAEACNNAVLHAYPAESPGAIDVKLEQLDDGLCIRVKDQGLSFNAREAIHRADSLHSKELNEIDVGGLGMYLMQSLMDEVEVHSNEGTEVMMTKRLYKSEEAI